MSSVFKSVALIGRHKTSEIIETLVAITNFLQSCHIKVVLEEETAKILPTTELPIYHKDILHLHSDLIIVIGGDGSLLNAANIAAESAIPILGINRGYLGFLTDIPPNNINKIGAILSGKYIEEQRQLLHTTIKLNDQVITECLALNDVVLLSSIAGHLVEFSVFINDEFVCDYRADGLITATPTGSTAHALSAFGPILHPSLEALVLVPMLSHNLSSRPLVIRNDSKIKIITLTSNTNQLRVSCDGHDRINLAPGSCIEITKAKKYLRLLHPLDYNYFETLRAKLHWES
jgi:NAD+ kinase